MGYQPKMSYTGTGLLSVLITGNRVNPLLCGACFFLTKYTTTAVMTAAAANRTKATIVTDTPTITATPFPCFPPLPPSAESALGLAVCSYVKDVGWWSVSGNIGLVCLAAVVVKCSHVVVLESVRWVTLSVELDWVCMHIKDSNGCKFLARWWHKFNEES